MKKLSILTLLVLTTTINLCIAMKKDSDEDNFFLDPKKMPSQYHSIGLNKQEYRKAKLALLYSWVHKNKKNKHQRANYRASQKYLNTLFKEQFEAKLSDDEEYVNVDQKTENDSNKSSNTTPTWVLNNSTLPSDDESETEDYCPSPSGSSSDSNTSESNESDQSVLSSSLHEEVESVLEVLNAIPHAPRLDSNDSDSDANGSDSLDMLEGRYF